MLGELRAGKDREHKLRWWQVKIGQIFISLLVTLAILLFFEIISSAILPGLGIIQFRPPFHVLIIFFLGHRLRTPLLPVIIFILEVFHGAFTIEGPSFGTFAGIIIGLMIVRLKEMMNFFSPAMQILMAFFLQWIWFFIVSFLIYLKVESWSYILNRLWVFLPESVVLALMAPALFRLLGQFWATDRDSSDDMRIDHV